MNGNGQLKRSTAPQPTAQQVQPRSGLFVPRQYAQEASVSERSLQINIDSEDDAKSVIQNLPAIKAAYDESGVSSVEFCIAESVAKTVENYLIGAIRWCRTYVKHIAPQPGNVLFPLPSYRDFSVQTKTAPAQAPESSLPVSAEPQAPVKPQRPVRAEPARQ